MDDGDDRKETHDEIECDMNDDIALMNVPIEKYEAKRESCYADDEVLFEARLFVIAVLADYISKEEKGYAPNKAVKWKVRSIVIILVCSV